MRAWVLTDLASQMQVTMKWRERLMMLTMTPKAVHQF